MSMNVENAFENFLNQHDDAAWNETIASLLPSIHEVDKTATPIWFRFYPLALLRALEGAEDTEKLAAQLLLQGNYYLKDQIDSSHTFLYGHRYWPEVKRAVVEAMSSFNASTSTNLAKLIGDLAGRVASQLKVEATLLTGLTAVALMTLQQVGAEAFKAATGTVQLDKKHIKKSPDQILRDRAKDDSQGMLGFLKTVNKEWTVTFDENDASAKYKMIDDQDLAYGAAGDQSQNWRARDPRRIEGPIPVECRSAACGTCWVGVLGGAEKLSDVAVREGKQIKEFGYINTNEPKPLIRLACQAKAYGAVSIVIPPWNGVFGKFLNAQQRQAENLPAPDAG